MILPSLLGALCTSTVRERQINVDGDGGGDVDGDGEADGDEDGDDKEPVQDEYANGHDEEEDDGSSSTSDTESGISPIAIASGIGLAAVGAGALVFLFLRKGGKDDEWASDSAGIYTDEDRLFNSPNAPAPGLRGEMMDGYECIEHPAGSGAWWYRDTATGKWTEWK